MAATTHNLSVYHHALCLRSRRHLVGASVRLVVSACPLLSVWLSCRSRCSIVWFSDWWFLIFVFWDATDKLWSALPIGMDNRILRRDGNKRELDHNWLAHWRCRHCLEALKEGNSCVPRARRCTNGKLVRWRSQKCRKWRRFRIDRLAPCHLFRRLQYINDWVWSKMGNRSTSGWRLLLRSSFSCRLRLWSYLSPLIIRS